MKTYGDAASWTRDRYDDTSDWASDRYEGAARQATYARRRSVIGVARARRHVERFTDENPVMIGVVGVAVGLLVGALLPSTRRENQYLGPYADEARDQGLRYARDIAEQGRHFVEESVERIPEAARQAAEGRTTGHG